MYIVCFIVTIKGLQREFQNTLQIMSGRPEASSACILELNELALPAKSMEELKRLNEVIGTKRGENSYVSVDI